MSNLLNDFRSSEWKKPIYFKIFIGKSSIGQQKDFISFHQDVKRKFDLNDRPTKAFQNRFYELIIKKMNDVLAGEVGDKASVKQLVSV